MFHPGVGEGFAEAARIEAHLVHPRELLRFAAHVCRERLGSGRALAPNHTWHSFHLFVRRSHLGSCEINTLLDRFPDDLLVIFDTHLGEQGSMFDE